MQFKKEIQPPCSWLQVSEARTNYFEGQIRTVDESLRMQRLKIATLQAECKALTEKRVATEEELQDHVRQRESIAAHLPQTAKRIQGDLDRLSTSTALTTDACKSLRSQEGQLEALARSLEKNLSRFTDDVKNSASMEDSKNSFGHRRWHRKSSKEGDLVILSTVKSAAEAARGEAATAVAMLASARHTQASQRAEAKVAKESTAKAEDTRLSALHALEEQTCSVAERSSGILRQMKLWQQLHRSYEQHAEDNEATLETEVDQLQLESLALHPVLHRSVRFRQAALVSPILAAWLVTAWWHIVWGQ